MQIQQKKYDTIEWGPEWEQAFGNPERTGVWFIYGGSSNGKSTFVMLLMKELARRRKVMMNALEEGNRLTLQKLIERVDLTEVNDNVLFVAEPMTDLDLRLKKARAPQVVVIDSFQYTRLSFQAYLDFKAAHSDKLLIFTSQADGRNPLGRTAVSVMYDADMKFHVHGFRAISKGRNNPGGYFTIWPEKAREFWGDND